MVRETVACPRGPPRPRALLSACALLACLCLGSRPATAAGAAGPEETCRLEPGPRLAVVSIVDSETMLLDDMSEVRLIGALAPRPPGGGEAYATWPPEREAREALERLVTGATIELQYAGRRTDRYGRRLAHVFVESAGARVWVQGYLLSHGNARAYALFGSTACLEEMLGNEHVARASALGLWANAAYKVRDAARTRELLERRNNFEIVEGKVESVAEVRGRIYLNFGRDWRSDFTVAVSPGLIRSSPEATSRLKALTGKRIRVRGWIERRNGPFIAVASLGEIEGLDDGGSEDPSTGGPDEAESERDKPRPAPEGQPAEKKRRPAGKQPGAIEL